MNNLTEKIPFRENLDNIRKLFVCLCKINKMIFVLPVISSVFSTATGYLGLILSAAVLDMLEAGAAPDKIIPAAAGYITLSLVLGICLNVLAKYAATAEKETYDKYYFMFSEKLMEMDYAGLDSPRFREIYNRIYKDRNYGKGVGNFFWQYNSLVSNAMNIVGAIVVGVPVIMRVFRQGNAVGIILLAASAAVNIALMKLRIKKDAQYKDAIMREQFTGEEAAGKASLTGQFANEEYYEYRNGKDVRIYDGYDLFWEYTYERMEKYEKAHMSWIGRKKAESTGVGNCMNAFTQGASYFIIGFVALKGTLSAGDIVVNAGALGRFLNGMLKCYEGYINMALEARCQASTLKLLSAEGISQDKGLPVKRGETDRYELEFDNVSFKYPGAEEYSIRGLSMKIHTGRKMAVVGMNGSGKTTMIKLLCRLYEPTEGRILLNGTDIRSFDTEEYRKLFAVVFQDFGLFSFEIGENVAGSRVYDRKKAEECLIKAGLGERLKKMKNGLDTMLYTDYDASGEEISGGEAQKIAIARALYRDSVFVLLDEPTAALDPLAENEIYCRFNEIVGNKTAVYISHRLSSCIFCEDIAVFDKGRLVQRGNHAALVADKKGKYYEMWNAQAQYYN